MEEDDQVPDIMEKQVCFCSFFQARSKEWIEERHCFLSIFQVLEESF
jgi:hypothetical protein